MNHMTEIADFFNYPIWMLFFGLLGWFVFLWSIERNKGTAKNYWFDKLDEILVSIIFGLIFLLYTDSVLGAWDWVFNNPEKTEFHDFFYLLVGPIIERIYQFFITKYRKNGS